MRISILCSVAIMYQRLVSLMIAASVLAGCGTYVPEIQEIGGEGQAQNLVQAIVRSIHCELRNSVSYVVDQDKRVAAERNHGMRSAPWFDDWGVQVGLTLTIDEKSSVSPSFSWVPNPVTGLFTLAGGAGMSADATRIEKLNFWELYT